MINRPGKHTISIRLILSFSIIIILFSAVTIYFLVLLNETDRLHRYNLNYSVARQQDVMAIHQEFTYLRLLTRRSFLSPVWRETANYDVWIQYEVALTNSYNNLNALINSYVMLTLNDDVVPLSGKVLRLEMMEYIAYYINRIYGLFQKNFFLDGERNYDDGDIMYYGDIVVYHLDILQQVAQDYSQEVLEDIESAIALNESVAVIAIAGGILVAALLAWLMVMSFTGRIKEIESHVLQIRKGDFSSVNKNGSLNDEISNLISDMVDIFTGLVSEINKVAYENEHGNIDARMDSDKFEGGYREAALAVNLLIESVRENQDQARDATENSQAKSRFLAHMSHEIRTPITAVLGISEIQLQTIGHPLAVEEAFAKIHNSASILLGIVNDILDLSKIEAGKMSVTNECYELASMIIDVVQLHLVYLGSKEIEFKVDADEFLPSFLIGDELRIKQVLNNLLSNAFKYTETGTVELTARRETHSNSDFVNLVFSIRDTGLGMSKAQLKTLYNEYVRFHDKHIKSAVGSGLGMSIVYSLVQLMDASIDVESQVGKGTHIVVRIPQRISGTDILGRETVDNLRQSELFGRNMVQKVNFTPDPMPYGKVAVVDDIDTNLYVAKGLLMFYDLQIETYTNAWELIDKIKNGTVYDIVFMDHMMPDLNGMEAVKILRTIGYSHPIVALTANALIGQAEEFLNNGFSGFISKPIQTVHLNRILNKFVRDKQNQEVIEAARAQSTHWEDKAQGMDGFLAQESKKLRQDFTKSQKNVMAEMKAAIAAGTFEIAERLAHNLKSLAGLINEDKLALAAADIERHFKTLTLVQMNLVPLEEELERVLASIEIKQEEAPVIRSNIPIAEQKAIYDQLQLLLNYNDTQCLELVPELKQMPETVVLVHQIEEYEFEAALVTLKILRDAFDL